MPNVNYILYSDTDGMIRQSGSCDQETLPFMTTAFGPGYSIMTVPAQDYRHDIDALSYVLDGKITAKVAAVDTTEFSIQANGQDTVSFAVPAGTSVVHENRIVLIEDSLFEFSTDVVGDHQFRFIAPAAFFNFEVTVHAV
ncbi:hypothetical protein GR212_15295 [Rhizobium lusitanum]|uniref:Uncharacterized protein n=1 Tax=Rhizobium lusitanum TaxID=293958 RepID=A0A6L9U8V4_9HYPH|nr:hypothetical protein [Rhizobium lusitanum]NEI70948.1 hypothetical protein [Rhizobium lusitanum]